MAIYLLKINLILVVLYGFYHLSFSRDTFFGWRRATLLGIYALAIAVPLLNVDYLQHHSAAVQTMAQGYELMLPEVTTAEQSGMAVDWWHGVVAIYIIGIALLSLRLLVQMASMLRLIRRAERVEIDGQPIYKVEGNQTPFSFFHWIFLNPDAQHAEQTAEILIHERTHARELHSFDVLLTELMTIVCWMNPVAWLMRREVRLNLEYLADNSVVADGIARKAYQYHLLGLAYTPATGASPLVNNFNVLPLKKRIRMMNKRRTPAVGRTKYVLIAPLALLLLGISNAEVVARTARQLFPSQAVVNEQIANTEQTAAPTSTSVSALASAPETTKEEAALEADAVSEAADKVESIPDDKEYDVVEVMPQYPGGMGALMQWLGANVRYPEEAAKNKIEGRVVVQFIVEKDGSVSNARVVRSIDPLLDAEALRVMNQMPRWTPGKQGGKEVRVKFNVPISFKLPAEEKTEPTPSTTAKAIPLG